MVCCCIRFRIPRTKQEIEADYQRKQIAKKFREKLQQIKNSDMDEMDLQKGNFALEKPLYSVLMWVIKFSELTFMLNTIAQ